MIETIINIGLVAVAVITSYFVGRSHGQEIGEEAAFKKWMEDDTYEDGFENGFEFGVEQEQLKFEQFISALEEAGQTNLVTKKVAKKKTAKKSK